jgi:7,8-dihydro-6-hydroxymethylpterin dimethyltransferase
LRKIISIAAAPAKPKTTSFEDQLERIAKPLRALSEADIQRQFSVAAADTLIKTTLSLCPNCLTHVPAVVVNRANKIWLLKHCKEHGHSSAVIENDSRFYHVSSKDRWGTIYASAQRLDIPQYSNSNACCGPDDSCAPSSPNDSNKKQSGLPQFSDQTNNKTCTVLVEITDACNLACRVCYSDSKGDRILPVALFKQHVLSLIQTKGQLDSVQVTGGEASMHPDFLTMVEWLCVQEGVGKVYLPTNGLLFNKVDVIARLKPFRERLLVLLQFDGRDDNTNPTLRKAKPEKQRQKLIKALDQAGIAMQLTMTLSHGVSESDIAWVVSQGLRHKNVRLVAMQPAFFSGRYDLEPSASERLTLSDCVKGIVQGLGGKAKTDDFMPIPCSHPNCGWVTLFARRFGMVKNIARHVDLNAVMNDVAYKTLLNKQQMQDIVGTKGSLLQRGLARLSRKLIRPQDVFGIAIKPFMDRFSYDQDRVSACCHHILDTQGNPVSFCEYNARLRHTDSWAHLAPLQQESTLNING